jgi:hypothetical protein
MTDDFDDDIDQHPLMTALGQGLPITLLVDLVDPNGPRSAEMYARERAGAARRSELDTAQTA